MRMSETLSDGSNNFGMKPGEIFSQPTNRIITGEFRLFFLRCRNQQTLSADIKVQTLLRVCYFM